MQPIIDIIYELAKDFIDAYFATHPPVCCFTDRGDPGSADWSYGNLTGDNTWRDLDLSGIVPEKTSAVILRIGIRSAFATKEIRFRKKGHTGWPNTAECRLVVADKVHHYDKTIAVDVDRKIQYKMNDPAFHTLVITVAAWYIGGDVVGGFHNRGDPAVHDFGPMDWGTDGLWHTRSLIGIIPAATSAILLHCVFRSSNPNKTIYFRTTDFTNTQNISIFSLPSAGTLYYFDVTIPTSGLQSFDYQIFPDTWINIDVTVKGWWY